MKKIIFKGILRETIQKDLARYCINSFERVGFIFGDVVNDVLIVEDYLPIKDNDYIKSSQFGAVFNKNPIKKSLEVILKRKKSCFQIHEHSKHYGSKFSQADLKTAMELSETFFQFNSDSVHGSIVLCEDEVNAFYYNGEVNINLLEVENER